MENIDVVKDSSGNRPSASLGGTFRVVINGVEQYIRVDVTAYGETTEKAIEDVKKNFYNLLRDHISALERMLTAQPVSGPEQQPSSQEGESSGQEGGKVPENLKDPVEILRALGIPRDWSYQEKVKAYHTARAQNRITYRQFEILRNYFKEGKK
ncbi:MAG: hypothetical protein ACP5QH_05930 [Thermoplasmata archaeon]